MAENKQDVAAIGDNTPAPKSGFKKALPVIAVVGAVAVVGGIAAGVALSLQDEEDNVPRQLNQLTLLNACGALAGSEISNRENLTGIAACFEEQAAFCDFNDDVLQIRLQNCSATQTVCSCGQGKVFARKVGREICNPEGAVDSDDESECEEISEAEDEFSDSSDESDTEDEDGLERLGPLLDDCSVDVDDFFECLNDELKFSCEGGVGTLSDCDNGRTDKCDADPGVRVQVDPCVVDENTSDSSETTDVEEEVTPPPEPAL